MAAEAAEEVEEEGASGEWYYMEEGEVEQDGPVDAEFLGKAVASGQLDRYSCVVWTDGMDDWLPIEEAPGLIDVLLRHLS